MKKIVTYLSIGAAFSVLTISSIFGTFSHKEIVTSADEIPPSETHQIIFSSASEDSSTELYGLSSIIESDISSIVKDSSASKVYAGVKGAKFSSSSSSGYASITLSKTLDINTITISAAQFKASDSNVTVTINNKTVLLSGEDLSTYTFNFFGQSIDELSISANKRLYIKSIYIETGYNFIDVESVTLDQHELSLNVGETYQLNPTILPANATNKEVSYNSNISGVATVSETGLVTAVSNGTATIRVVTVNGAKIDECVVTVSTVDVPVTGVSISRSSLEMEVGDAQIVYAHVEPTNATNQNVGWLSNDESIATVEEGYIEAVGEGTTIIVVSTEDGGFTDSLTVTVSEQEVPPLPPVEDKELESIEIITLPTKTEYVVGDLIDLGGICVYAYFSDDTFDDVSSDITCDKETLMDLGVQEVTISYTYNQTTKHDYFNIVVVQAETVISYTLMSTPTKTEYKIGEELDLTGLSIQINIRTGTSVIITPYNGGVTTEGFNNKKAGTYNVSIIVDDGTVVGSYDVTVKKKGFGCKGDITTTSVVLASISVLGLMGLIASKIIKKKED